MEREVKNLPKWAMERGHPFPRHGYHEREDGALMVVCPEELVDLNLWVWKCQHEEASA